MSITDNLLKIKGSLPKNVTLVAVSKTHPTEAVAKAYAAGQRIFGESRPQEMRDKYTSLPKDIEWHMIGHLQTNKVKYIAPFVALVHSIDSQRLLECINHEAAKNSRVIDILLEIHVAEEISKTGWDIAELRAYLEEGSWRELKNVRIRGVMSIATNTDDESRVRGDFERLMEYRAQLAEYFDENFNIVSMGMSDDYELAIACGSTMVRIGSKIFGERDYSK